MFTDKIQRRIFVPGRHPVVSRFHMETLIIYKLGSMKFTTQNDRSESFYCKRAVILVEAKFLDYNCFHMKSGSVHSQGYCGAARGAALPLLRGDQRRAHAQGENIIRVQV